MPLTAHRTLSLRCYRSNAHHQRGKHPEVHSNYTRLPSHQAVRPTPARLPHQDGPWSRPQQNPPYQHPKLPSKRLSLIHSPLIHQIHAPSTHSHIPHTHTCMCGQMGRTAPRLCYHLVAKERLTPKQIKVYKTRHHGTLGTTSTSAIL